MRYGCSIRGVCEPSYVGDYASLEQCEAECQGSEAVDLVYLILSYDWATVVRATPSDQRELLKREFDLRVSLDDAVMIVDYLAQDDFLSLLRYSSVFVDYVEERISSLDIFLLETIEILTPYYPLEWRSFRERAIREISLELAEVSSSLQPYDHIFYVMYGLEQRIATRLIGGITRDPNVIETLSELVGSRLPELFRLLDPVGYEVVYRS